MNFLGRPDPSLQGLSDEALIKTYQTNRNKALISELFCRYTTLTYGVCRKYLEDPDDAKDAVLQIFEKLFDTLLAEEPQTFRPWLYTVARNHCLMQLRKSGKPALRDEFSESVMESEETTHPERKEAMLQYLEQAQQSLPEGQSLCIRLFYLEEKSYKEIADATGFTLNEIKSHIQNGKRNLKNLMEKGGYP
jgi:RNA polymerase sigma factor (sigma-70 family)